MISQTFSPLLQKAIQENGFTKATEVQDQVIPLVLENKDVMVKAQTGSGKSAAFILPILEKITQTRGEAKKAKLKALILTPTRELTLQVSQAFINFGQFLKIKPKVVSVVGGESLGDQLHDIQQGCDIVVATSGRLLDVLSKKQMNLSFLEFFVLDEADKMLNLGFEEELDLILKAIPQTRQNLLFSATYPQKMLDIAAKITQNPTEVHLTSEEPIVQSISQRVIEVNQENRSPLLRHILDENDFKLVLVFMANKRATENIAQKFRKRGYKADAFHGDLEQEDRNYVMNGFRAKKFNIMFATDIAARGLDIDDIDCVINFDLPRSPADYIHRIGRTARAGRSGTAISFIDYDNMAHFKLIEKRSQIRLEREQIEGFELTGEAPIKMAGNLPVKGKKKSKKDKLREQAALEKKESYED